jgi:hypothetical protein
MYRREIASLIYACKTAARAGASLDEIKGGMLRDRVRSVVKEISPREFLEWVKEDREYSSYFYEAQQSGACAKPREAAALILEAIAIDAIEEDDTGIERG